jgi:hypothetical protein
MSSPDLFTTGDWYPDVLKAKPPHFNSLPQGARREKEKWIPDINRDS